MRDGDLDAYAGHFPPSGVVEYVHTFPSRLPEDFALRLVCASKGPEGPELSEVEVPVTGGIPCQLLDFDYTLGADEPEKGKVLADEWAELGMSISATNNAAGHPDLAVVFDSANPGGGDPDLATPGFGAGNDTALGKLLIVAENDIDANFDDLIDDPDDEAGGGVVAFDFAEPATLCSVTLVDVDDGPPTELRFLHGDGSTSAIPVQNLGDNSAQTIGFSESDVVRFEVAFGGSGGIAQVEIQPCPRLVNLDETVFGIPLGLLAGTDITEQFADLGLHLSAINAAPRHPSKAILFDTENPTGGDFDLMTPGPGFGNDTPLGMVLIIAENDVDANRDGLVDDPDDEEAGGRMLFNFDEDITFFSTTVLDVDGTEVDTFDFFDAQNNLLATIDIDALGDNSVQQLVANPPIANVRRIELSLGGSGAVTRLRWCVGDATGDGGL